MWCGVGVGIGVCYVVWCRRGYRRMVCGAM